MAQIISRGAEAILTRDGNTLMKNRVKKSYRITQLDDKLRKERTRHESSLLNEARAAGVLTPQVKNTGDNKIEMQFIEGARVKDILNETNVDGISEKMGTSIARLHTFDIIHGDLTTSNMIFQNGRLFFIDFGLGYHSQRTEDKAVDLYLLYHAIEAAHWQILEKAWKIILNAYRENYENAERVIKTLDEIESRGRYRKRNAE